MIQRISSWDKAISDLELQFDVGCKVVKRLGEVSTCPAAVSAVSSDASVATLEVRIISIPLGGNFDFSFGLASEFQKPHRGNFGELDHSWGICNNRKNANRVTKAFNCGSEAKSRIFRHLQNQDILSMEFNRDSNQLAVSIKTTFGVQFKHYFDLPPSIASLPNLMMGVTLSNDCEVEVIGPSSTTIDGGLVTLSIKSDAGLLTSSSSSSSSSSSTGGGAISDQSASLSSSSRENEDSNFDTAITSSSFSSTVDAALLFDTYDINGSGVLELSELLFLIQDAMIIRDRQSSKPKLVTVRAALDRIFNHQQWSQKGRVRRELFLGAVKNNGFLMQEFHPTVLKMLYTCNESSSSSSSSPYLDLVRSRQEERISIAQFFKLKKIKDSQEEAVFLALANDEPQSPASPNLCGGGSTPVGSTTNTALCINCFETSDIKNMYTSSSSRTNARLGPVFYQKLCKCAWNGSQEYMMCVDCLRQSVKVDISRGVAPHCPGYEIDEAGVEVFPPQRCKQKLDSSKIADFFIDECCLCSTTFSSSSTDLLTTVECPMYHKFCNKCLAFQTINAITIELKPSCPRFCECKYYLEREDVIKALDNEPNSGEILQKWFNVCLAHANKGNPFTKSCKSPDCKGFLTKPVVGGAAAECKCSSCHQSFCFLCEKKYHYNLTCVETENVDGQWMSFLSSLTNGSVKNDSGGAAAGGGGGGTTSADSAGAVTAAAKALFDRKARHDSNQYFHSLIASNLLKKCPHCSRQIQKIDGCDSMYCGKDAPDKGGRDYQSGCGKPLLWSSLPTMSFQELEDKKYQDAPSEINYTDPQIDLNSLCAFYSPRLLACSRCKNKIKGTRFDCINCPQQTSLCIQCIHNHLATSELPSNPHMGHIFKLVHPMKQPQSLIKVVKGEISSSGKITTYGLSEAMSAAAAASASDVLSSNVTTGGRGGRGVNVGRPGHVTAGQQATAAAHRALSATVVRVDVHPDGKIVYADNVGLASKWISLDSISFKLKGAMSYRLRTAGGLFKESLRPPGFLPTSSGVVLGYGHLYSSDKTTSSSTTSTDDSLLTDHQISDCISAASCTSSGSISKSSGSKISTSTSSKSSDVSVKIKPHFVGEDKLFELLCDGVRFVPSQVEVCGSFALNLFERSNRHLIGNRYDAKGGWKYGDVDIFVTGSYTTATTASSSSLGQSSELMNFDKVIKAFEAELDLKELKYTKAYRRFKTSESSRPKPTCGHFCSLTSRGTSCCRCLDSRPDKETSLKYVDGVGWVVGETGERIEAYCPTCRVARRPVAGKSTIAAGDSAESSTATAISDGVDTLNADSSEKTLAESAVLIDELTELDSASASGGGGGGDTTRSNSVPSETAVTKDIDPNAAVEETIKLLMPLDKDDEKHRNISDFDSSDDCDDDDEEDDDSDSEQLMRCNGDLPEGCSARRTVQLGANICEGCGGRFRQCAGSYGMRDRSGNGMWRRETSTDLNKCPESPNTRWCCAGCEAMCGGRPPAVRSAVSSPHYAQTSPIYAQTSPHFPPTSLPPTPTPLLKAQISSSKKKKDSSRKKKKDSSGKKRQNHESLTTDDREEDIIDYTIDGIATKISFVNVYKFNSIAELLKTTDITCSSITCTVEQTHVAEEIDVGEKEFAFSFSFGSWSRSDFPTSRKVWLPSDGIISARDDCLSGVAHSLVKNVSDYRLSKYLTRGYKVIKFDSNTTDDAANLEFLLPKSEIANSAAPIPTSASRAAVNSSANPHSAETYPDLNSLFRGMMVPCGNDCMSGHRRARCVLCTNTWESHRGHNCRNGTRGQFLVKSNKPLTMDRDVIGRFHESFKPQESSVGFLAVLALPKSSSNSNSNGSSSNSNSIRKSSSSSSSISSSSNGRNEVKVSGLDDNPLQPSKCISDSSDDPVTPFLTPMNSIDPDEMMVRKGSKIDLSSSSFSSFSSSAAISDDCAYLSLNHAMFMSATCTNAGEGSMQEVKYPLARNMALESPKLLSPEDLVDNVHTTINIDRGTNVYRDFLATSDGNYVHLFSTKRGDGRQTWNLIKVSDCDDDLYNICLSDPSSVASGNTFLGHRSVSGARVELFASDDGSGCQRWSFVEISPNIYHILSKPTASSHHVYLSCKPDGIVELVSQDDNSGRQQWNFEKSLKLSKSSPMASLLTDGDMVYLKGKVIVSSSAATTAPLPHQNRQSTAAGSRAPDGMLLGTLPEASRPRAVHDFLVFYDNGTAEGRAIPGYVRLSPNGELKLLTDVSQGVYSQLSSTPPAFPIGTRVCLDSIRFKLSDRGEVALNLGSEMRSIPPQTTSIAPLPSASTSTTTSTSIQSSCVYSKDSICYLYGKAFKSFTRPAVNIAGMDGLPVGGMFKPGDVIGVLPEASRPSSKLTFACAAGSAPTWPTMSLQVVEAMQTIPSQGTDEYGFPIYLLPSF